MRFDTVVNINDDELEFICNACGVKMEVVIYDDRAASVTLRCRECDKVVENLQGDVDSLNIDVEKAELRFYDLKAAVRHAIEILEDVL